MGEQEAIAECVKRERQEEAHQAAMEKGSNGSLCSHRDKLYKIRLQYGVKDLARVIPNLSYMRDKQLSGVLWHLGYDTKNFNFSRETCQYMDVFGKRQYGEVIVGSERTDKEYITQRGPDGKLVASEEAIWYNAGDVRRVMRENSKREHYCK